MKTVVALSLVSFVSLLGCTEEFKPPPRKKVDEKEKSNIVKVETAVPYGKKVACDKLFSPEKVSEFVGDVVEIKDNSKSNADATSVCAIMRSGEKPESAPELKEGDKAQILGVMPGDEYCTITLSCSVPVDRERFKDQCQKKGDEGNRDLGQYACVHASQRAAKYAYTYKTIHAGSGCVIEVMGGPSVTDEQMVQHCTRAGLDLLKKENLKWQ